MIQLFAVLQSLAPKRDEKGATAVEYGLMVALIAAAIILTVTALGGSLDTLFQEINTAITGA